MKLKCEYCEHYFTDTDELCPNCGAANPNLKRNANKIPQTIEELKAFCVDHDLPLEKMHFHIGEDYKEPKAFGIYKDEKTENFVVYKNKANGQRAIRYEGKDEAYAVNEIYQKMKDETLEEREFKANKGRNRSAEQDKIETRQMNAKVSKYAKWFFIIYAIAIVLYFVITILVAILSQDTGYYKYKGDLYYYRGGSWYYYDNDANDWYRDYDVDDELSDNYENYYESENYDSSYGGSDYRYSDSYYDNYYESDNNYDDDWDDDDWDSGSSWDSDYGSDWDSDW